MTTTEITRHGITWTLEGHTATGTFANGDPWVVGGTITAISPVATEGARDAHGSMIDPSPLGVQGFDGNGSQWLVGSYDVETNAALELPIELTPGQCLVSVESREPLSSWPGSTIDPVIKTAAVLTCLEDVPTEERFRPPYTGPNKPATPMPLRSDINLANLVRAVPAHYATPAILSNLTARMNRLWLEVFPHWS